MEHLSRVIETFPSISINDNPKILPIEVSLIAQLGHGAGNHLFASVASRQKTHHEFVDELDEPSVKLAGTNISLGDTTSLYSFVVGPKGHPFHKHAGHRIFTAVSGSGGAQLRFSTATSEQIKTNPQNFIKHLNIINIPPDCLFTVRFGGETWHQFHPLSKNSPHPVFFALSCHTDELGGNLSQELKNKIVANEGNIPNLTELLPEGVLTLLKSHDFKNKVAKTTTLSLDAPAGTMHRKVCDSVRGNIGILRGAWGQKIKPEGYITVSKESRKVVKLNSIEKNSLLSEHLVKYKIHHDDSFTITIDNCELSTQKADKLLAIMLEGFLMNAPSGVGSLMKIRNILVKPFGLRTSPLGCPVSSLLSDNTNNLFANKYPVLDKRVNTENTMAQVILGANDKHLQFRSCIGVEILNNNSLKLSLGNRIHCKNLFGQLYMSIINLVHKHYIGPAMLRRSVDYLFSQVQVKDS